MRRVSSIFFVLAGMLVLAASRGQVGPATVPAGAPTQDRLLRSWGRVPLHFEAGNGKGLSGVEGVAPDFVTRGAGYAVAISATESVVVVPPAPRKMMTGVRGGSRNRSAPPLPTDSPSVVHMRLLGANQSAPGTKLEPLPGRVNYYHGNDPAKWRTDVRTYGRIRYEEVYPGIDLVYYGNQQQLEHDFIVAPGADPASIRMTYESTGGTALTESGDLLLHTDAGDLRQLRPVSYQEVNGERQPVESRYCLQADGQVTVSVGSYDPRRPLVIDPVLTFSSYLGGSNYEYGGALLLAEDGSVLLSGMTYSPDFPAPNAFDPELFSVTDAFIARLDPTGTSLTYATYFGGNGWEMIHDMVLGADGSLYVAGESSATNLPVTVSLQQQNRGYIDGFVAHFNAAGNVLLYSTYLGGEAEDIGRCIALDAAGNVYVGGSTQSSDFPTLNPFRVPLTFSTEGFIAKINPTATALVYSSYLGGFDTDLVTDLALETDGSVYLVGYTHSHDFPLVNPMFPRDQRSAFLVHVNSAGSGLLHASTLGGALDDEAHAVALDGQGALFLTGYTGSDDFPLVRPLQAVHGGAADVFVAQVDLSGPTLAFSTLLGGNANDFAYALALDPAGAVYVAGETQSDLFPTVEALQAQRASPATDAFLTKIDPATPGLVYSTYLGGSGEERGVALAVDAAGNAYVQGETSSLDFPTASPFQPSHGRGFADTFVSKVGVMPPPAVPTGLTALPTSQTTMMLTWVDASDNEATFELERKPGTAASGAPFVRIASTAADTPTHPDTGLTAETTYTYRVRAVNPGGPSRYSAMATATTLPPPPDPPTHLTATAVSSTQINLQWVDQTSREEFFELERGQDPSSFALLVKLGPNQTAFADTGLEPEREYTYRVRATNAGGASAYAGPESEQTLPLPPAPPTGLTVIADSTTQLTLQWVDASTNESAFEVERRNTDQNYSRIATLPAGAVTFSEAGLPANSSRTYRVRAVNAGGASDYAGPVLGTTLPLPPAGLTASVESQTRLALSWNDPNPVPAATEIERRIAGSPSDFSVTVSAGATAYTDTGLTADTEYVYRIRTVNNSGASPFTDEVSARTLPNPPSAPTGLAVTAVSPTQLNLTWEDTSTNETHFEVERSHGSGAFTLLASLGAGSTSFADAGRTPNTPYTYRVRAVNSGGGSAYTGAATAYTLPLPPAGLQVLIRSKTAADLTWTEQNPTPTAYRIERSTGKSGFAPLASVPVGTLSHADTSLTPGTTYHYRLWATNASGDSPSAAEGSATTRGGKLKVTAKVNFGKVTLGTSRTRPLVIRNLHRTEPLQVTVPEPAQPFTLVGGGRTLTLPPRGSATLTLQYEPTARGRSKGLLNLVTTDAARANARVSLLGVGR